MSGRPRSALVTGGASGIGLATMRRLRAGGARVACADLRDPPEGSADLVLRADVADPAGWPELVSAAATGLGGLDIVHLNAGVISGISDIVEIDEATYRRLVGVNVDHVFFGIRAAIPILASGGGGRIVVTASLAGLGPFPVDPVYTLSKHAVVGLVRSAAATAAGRGITLTAVCPGIVDTPLIGDDRERFAGAGFPLLDPDDVAAAVEAALERGAPGDCWFVQPGRAPQPFRFPNLPGPRTPGREGMRPPL